MRTRTGVIVVVLGLLAAACEMTGGRPESVTVRDSAGIRIVEHAGTEELETWTLASTHQVEFGGAMESVDGQLFQIWHAFRLSDGRVVAADRSDARLKFYGADGRYLSSSGGEGEGPGEFRQISYAGRTQSDSIVVYDVALHRASVFAPDGTYAREYRLTKPDGSPALAAAHEVFGDGSLIATAFIDVRNNPPQGRMRQEVQLYRFDPTGAQAAELGTFLSNEIYYEPIGDGFRVYQAPFARSSENVATGDRLYSSDNERYEIRLLSPDGELRMLVRRGGEPRPATDAALATWREQQFARYADPNARRELDRVLSDMPIPETMPAHGRVRTDDLGYLWVEDYRAPGEESATWTVFEPDGIAIARVAFPERFDPLQIGEDYVLGLWEDPFDVQHLRLHALTR